MSSVAKKPPPSGRETPTGNPARPTPRGAPSPSLPTNGPGSVARTRSLRTGPPMSARAAAAAGRRESPLGNGPSGNSSGSEGAGDEMVRAETVALLEDLKERLGRAETSSETYRRQAEGLQGRLDETLNEQARLEERMHECEEQLEALANEKREAARQTREMEAIYETERSAWQKEKDERSNREEEMQTVIQRLKDSLAQRNSDDEGRPSRQLASNSPSIDNCSFAPPSSLQRSDSRNNSTLLLQKDKLIESLRLELAEAQIKLVESENKGGGRLQEVERLLMEARMANARLLEDNESYQLLLQEKTLKGDFGTSDFSYMGGGSANMDALAALEGRAPGGASLADELGEAGHGADGDENNAHLPGVDLELVRRLESELKASKDQNKALTLYINKIIERLLQHQDFEHILDQSQDFKVANVNKDLPAAPRATGSSILQRAKSLAVGPGRPRPRPMSFMPSAPPSYVTNPDTAPSIPIGLGRSASARRGRPMSEQFTGVGELGAAHAINATFKGEGGGMGPLSPPLRTGQNLAFSSVGTGQRHSSGASATTTTSTTTAGGGLPMSTGGNFPGMKSETSSMSGDSVNGGGAAGVGGDGSTPPSQSPPRSHHEKPKTFTGGKPRPLRLVQENPETVQSMPNKRQSWMGWASSAFTKKEDAEMIRE